MKTEPAPEAKTLAENRGKDIAIIGIACRLPGANHYLEFWQNLINNCNSIREITKDRWDVARYYSTDFAEPGKTISKWAGLIDNISLFDNQFFNISPREAKNMDPQQRLLLEEAYHCIEDSGVSLKELSTATTSVIVGVMGADYHQEISQENILTDSFAALGNYDCILANRLSYAFGLRGESLSIDAACASSLVAVHRARHLIQSGQSDYALAAGVNLNIHPWKYVSFSKSRMLSPQGQCRTFDKDADGYVPGDGVAVVLLQSYEKALRAGNNVYGIIRGSAVNHGGKSTSITAPEVAAQERLILSVLNESKIDPETIAYVEAHGPGTSLGDPIEVEALNRAFRQFTSKRHYCDIGSVKTNIGHLEACAGLAGLIKVLMMFKFKQVPALLNLQQINPIINFTDSPFVPVTELKKLEPIRKDLPLRAAISSFGFGGVNSHLLIEEDLSGDKATRTDAAKDTLFILSAKDEKSLRELLAKWESFVSTPTFREANLGDISQTLIHGRSMNEWRFGLLVETKSQLIDLLESQRYKDQQLVYNPTQKPATLHLALFPWQGYNAIPRVLRADRRFQHCLNHALATIDLIKGISSPSALFRDDQWPAKWLSLFSFIANHALVNAITAHGITPSLLCPKFDARLLGLVIADIINLKDAILLITGEIMPPAISLRRPNIAISNALTGDIIHPLHISAKYLRSIIERMSVQRQELKQAIHKALLIKDSQFTFRRHIETWNSVITDRDFSFQSMDELLNLTKADELDSQTSLLLIVIIMSSLQKMNRRWGLRESLQLENPELNELIDLLADEVMEPLEFIHLNFNVNHPDFVIYASWLNKRLAKLSANHPYSILRSFNQTLAEIPNLAEWLNLPDKQPFSFNNGALIINAGVQVMGDGNEIVLEPQKELQHLALDLWRRGFCVDWEEDKTEAPYRKVPLPTYAFVGKHFWISANEKNNLLMKGKLDRNHEMKLRKNDLATASEVSSKRISSGNTTTLFPLDRERLSYRRRFSKENSIVFQNRMGTHCLLPVAVFIKMAEEGVRLAFPKAKPSLASLITHDTVIVDDILPVDLFIDPATAKYIIKTAGKLLAEGRYLMDKPPAALSFDINILRDYAAVNISDIYEVWQESTRSLGAVYRTVKKAWRLEQTVVFSIDLSSIKKLEEDHDITAILYESIWQGVVLFQSLISSDKKISFPLYDLNAGSIAIFGPLTNAAYMKIKPSQAAAKESQFDVTIYDDEGKSLLEMLDAIYDSHRREPYLPVDDAVTKVDASFAITEPEVSVSAPQKVKSATSMTISKAPESLPGTPTELSHTSTQIFEATQKQLFQPALMKILSVVIEAPIASLNTETDLRDLGLDSVLLTDFAQKIQDDFQVEFNSAMLFEYNNLAKIALYLERQAKKRSHPKTPSTEAGILASLHLFSSTYVRENLPPSSEETLAKANRRLLLVFTNDDELRQKLVELTATRTTIYISTAEKFMRLSENVYGIDPANDNDYRTLGSLPLLFEHFAGGIDVIWNLGVGQSVAAASGLSLAMRNILLPLTLFTKEMMQRKLDADLRLIAIYPNQSEASHLFKALIGFARSLSAENSRFQYSLLAADSSLDNEKSQLAAILLTELAERRQGGEELLYRGNERYQAALVLKEHIPERGPLVTRRGTYIITGGLGGIGRVMAHYLAMNYPVNLVLTGRSKLDHGRETALKQLEEQGAKVIYVPADITNPADVSHLVNTTKASFGTIRGIFHAAGVIHDGYLTTKSWKNMEEVINAKIIGLTLLDEATREEPLDFLIAFSSIVAILGNAGQTDYAFANCYMDSYLKAREARHARRSLSINWPLWVEGGMQVEKDTLNRLSSVWGDRLPSSVAVNALQLALATDNSQILITYADLDRLLQTSPLSHLICAKSNAHIDDAIAHTPPEQGLTFSPPITTSFPLATEKVAPAPKPVEDEIAIVGMAGRLPSSDGLAQFWQNLVNGIDCVSEIPKNRWNWQDYLGDPQTGTSKTMVKEGGFITDVDRFDARFFNISPLESQWLDPQHRLVIETVWHAIEDAGHDPQSLSGSDTGIYIGISNQDYQELLTKQMAEDRTHRFTGNAPTMLPNRISYILDIHGPSRAIDTACSSALTAIHQAVSALNKGECSAALVASVNLMLSPSMTLSFSKIGALSPDARCKTFSADANGYVRSEGVGAIYLKPLSQALRDGNHIYGIIKATGENHGGYANTLTSPNPAAQTSLIVDTWRAQGINPLSVDYIETHGTGTVIGDPVEINALKKSLEILYDDFAIPSNTTHDIGLGAVKTNIGHLEPAAGMAGLFKILLSLQHGLIPGNLHFRTINPAISLTNCPFSLINNNREWPAKKAPRRAGLLAFGIGGSNAHLVIEEYPLDLSRQPLHANVTSDYLFILSARCESALRKYVQLMLDFISGQAPSDEPGSPGIDLADFIYTLQVGRTQMASRIAVLIRDWQELVTRLQQFLNDDHQEIYYAATGHTAPLAAALSNEASEALKKSDLAAWAEAWIQGHHLPWQQIYGEKPLRRLSLPLYPFEDQRYWLPEAAAPILPPAEKEITSSTNLQELLLGLQELAADTLKTSIAEIDPECETKQLGFDSLAMVEFASRINMRYSTQLSPADLFEHTSIHALSVYIFGLKASPTWAPKPSATLALKANPTEEVAIIGISGRFPASGNVDEFWSNLVTGNNLLTQAPKQRESLFSTTSSEAHSIIWGGFIPDVDKFDNEFFSISPNEVEWLDPQQRLLLEEVWHAIEDAGHSVHDFAGTKTGVFIGAATSDYYELLLEKYPKAQAFRYTGNASAMLANRISYFYDLHGPSLALDTACSSSLVAIHEAANAIRRGDCDMAIAGAVSLILHPGWNMTFAAMGALSPDGKCKAFDANADGYVRSEGLGVLLLKPLAKAKADNDRIYAVIKGSAVNHGGRANSLTAPNPTQQAQLIYSAAISANVEPESISYIETHGTGTKLGDSIEIQGLTKAFKQLYAARGKELPATALIAIGSVKGNVGHLEAAAGMSSIIKVLLAMQHKRIPGNLHFEQLNPYINLEKTPFYILDKTREWRSETPRRAGISAYGIGGTNAHIILEEHENNADSHCLSQPVTPQLILISAFNEERLRANATRLRDYLGIRINNHLRPSIDDIAYTLQVGRAALNNRLAFVANSYEDIIQGIQKYLSPTFSDFVLYTGSVTRPVITRLAAKNSADLQTLIDTAISEQDLQRLAHLWCRGGVIDWQKLHWRRLPKRLVLPLYQFVRKASFLPAEAAPAAAIRSSDNQKQLSSPLRTTFSGQEFFLRDHKVGGHKTLPGVCYFNLALTAAEQAFRSRVTTLKNIAWVRPIMVGDHPVSIDTEILHHHRRKRFRIIAPDSTATLYAQGEIEEFDSFAGKATPYSISETIRRMKTGISPSELYDQHHKRGIIYGDSFRSIGGLWFGKDELLAELNLSPNVATYESKLHPSLMDGALQSAMALVYSHHEKLFLPFALDLLRIHQFLTPHCYVHVQSRPSHASGTSAFDLNILTDEGILAVEMKGFRVRQPQSTKEDKIVTLYYSSKWQSAPLFEHKEIDTGPIWVFDHNPHFFRELAALHPSLELYFAGPASADITEIDRPYFTIEPGNERQLHAISQRFEFNRRLAIIWRLGFSLHTDPLATVNQQSAWFSTLMLLTKNIINSKPTEKIHLLSMRPFNSRSLTNSLSASLPAFHRTVGMESSKLIFRDLALAEHCFENAEAASLALIELGQRSPGPDEIRYKNNQREINVLTEIDVNDATPKQDQLRMRRDGIYLITGGLGGLGLIFARHLITQGARRLALLGRSSLENKHESKLAELKKTGAEVIYLSSDLADSNALATIISTIKLQYGAIHGIIHAAGVNHDSYLYIKTLDEWQDVLRPKVLGTTNLLTTILAEPMDFFIGFSSIAADLGNFGQADYAFANRYMDNLTSWAREKSALLGNSTTRYASIHWPLWQDGGMQISAASKELMLQRWGILPLTTEAGIEAFTKALNSSALPFGVVSGHSARLRKFITPRPFHATNSCKEALIKKLQKVACQLLKVAIEDIDPNESLASMGFEPFSLITLLQEIANQLTLTINPAAIYTIESLDSLADYLLENFSTVLTEHFSMKACDTACTHTIGSPYTVDAIVSDSSSKENKMEKRSGAAALNEELIKNIITSIALEILKIPQQELDTSESLSSYGFDSISFTEFINQINATYNTGLSPTILFEYPDIDSFVAYLAREEGHAFTEAKDAGEATVQNIFPTKSSTPLASHPASDFKEIKPISEVDDNEIAIVGMSGQLPASSDLNEFWGHLVQNDDMISEIPANRWRWPDYYGDPDSGPQKTKVKWGGFLKEIDSFDGAFFNLSPREIEWLDPQHRLLLETIWHTIEDAGHAAHDLKGSQTGVFVALGVGDYQENLTRHVGDVDAYTFTGNGAAMLPNRISYFFDLRGPSFMVNTTCSSSLIAIHRAVQSIKSGECDKALVGAVNLILNPALHLGFSKAGMLSPDGHCKTFDKAANGYVRSEGVGAIFIKKLGEARRDRNPIYAIIKGTAENHGGNASSFTAPNPKAQKELIISAVKAARIDPKTITYIETHGTGTSLGDPIEINALKTAFQELLPQKFAAPFCGLGSVKTNMGHAEVASGMASLFKVLLALKHKSLPGLLHFQELNPHIQLDKSPFFIVDCHQPWQTLKDSDGNAYPRRAGISSFGIGGSNAHIIVEEYITSDQVIEQSFEEQLILISAKGEEKAQTSIQRLADFLEQEIIANRPPNLSDLAFTLQTGREAMDYRIAITANSVPLLLDKLRNLLRGVKPPGVYEKQTTKPSSHIAQIIEGEEAGAYVTALMRNRNLGKLAQLWLAGVKINWNLLSAKEGKARLLRLPGYPFAKTKYSMPPQVVPISGVTTNKSGERLYQLLDKSWVKSSRPSEPREINANHCVILCNCHSYDLAHALSSHLNLMDATILSDHQEEKRPGRRKANYINYFDAAMARNLAVKLKPELIIDLSDILTHLGETCDIRLAHGKIAFFQQIIEHKFPVRILHFTHGLQNFLNPKLTLAGATFVGFVKTFGHEYGHITSRTIDLDLEATDSSKLSAIIKQEFNEPSSISEVCYRGGERFLPTLRSIEKYEDIAKLRHLVDATRLASDKVVLIIGGTGGLGRAVATQLVKDGVKKLALMGREALPPNNLWPTLIQDPLTSKPLKEKLHFLLTLHQKGIVTEIYTGSLLEAEKIDGYLKRVRERLGEISGVFHCAGSFDSNYLAFINKPMSNIDAVFEAKLGGLQLITSRLAARPIDFFVLFSSISAVLPTLAIGASDYAAANAFMDHFAAYSRQHHHCNFLTLNWPSWKEEGIGEVSSQAYLDSGLLSITTIEAMALLKRSLILGEHVNIIPVVSDSGQFNLQKALIVSRNQKPETPKELEVKQLVNNEPALRSAVSDLIEELREMFAKELRFDPKSINADTEFYELGIDSILIAELVRGIERWLKISLDPSILLSHTTLARLADHLLRHYPGKLGAKHASDESRVPLQSHLTEPLKATRSTVNSGLLFSTSDNKIAVIGIGCHFPGAPSKERFWHNLKSGKDSITEVPPSRWDTALYYRENYMHSHSYSKWGGFIDGIEYFDPQYFGFTDDEALHIDPLIRQILEVTVDCIKDAGYQKLELDNQKIGVFIGARMSNYQDRIKSLARNSILGMGQNFIGSHLSHFLNLKGPNLVVDTACSSSLVSIHLACQSLINGESELALAGGADILLDEKPYLILSEARALSAEGRCFTFDSKANGFVPGEGAGMVLLKPLGQAIKDGDQIYAIIDGSAVNNDGTTMGNTTPNPEAQQAVITEAISRSGVDVSTISYIEAHGTGTMIGDPIELKGLDAVFRRKTAERQFCGLGSVKTNVGHLLSAAGIASFIKVALSLKYRELPPTLNCSEPNPRFEFEKSPFYIQSSCEDWLPTSGPLLRAGISSFGFGGTNAHLIMSGFDPLSFLPYILQRQPLPPVKFNRRYLWLPKGDRLQAKPAMTLLAIEDDTQEAG